MSNECQECGGEGTVEVDGKLRECICEFLRRIGAAMPPVIRTAMVTPDHARLPILDYVNRSLFVVGRWADVRAVLKAVWIKHSRMHVSITSDREIRDVYVGSMSRAAKGKDTEDVVFNNLSDLMDPPDLSIVRLGELSYKNKAAPGALEEACAYRLDRNKPTWVVSDADRPFTRSSHAWSESVMHLFNSTMAKFTIPAIAPRPTMADLTPEPVRGSQIASRNDPATQSAQQVPSIPDEPPEPPDEPQYEIEDDDDIPAALRKVGGGLSKKGRRR